MPASQLASVVVVSVVLVSAGAIPPESVFRSIPTTVKTSENDTVLLPCYVDNIGSSSVRWLWGNRLLADTSQPDYQPPPRVRMFPNHTLEVSQLTPEDTGEYVCQVIRPHPWGPIQQVHAIEVLYPPSVFPFPESGQLEANLGEEVIMECKAMGVPRPIITWSFKGKEMELLDNRHRLKFVAENKKLAGTYQCTASNGVGEPASTDIDLTILYPPEITLEHTWVHSSPGERAELSCTVDADPPPRIDWYKDGRTVTKSSNILFRTEDNKHSVHFRKVTVEDFGQYTCKASNKLGYKEKIINLSGVAKPAVFKKDKINANGNNFTLIWEADSYSPIIEYNLLFRKKQPKSETAAADWAKLVIPAEKGGPLHSKSFTLTGLQPATVYEVMLISRNRFGLSMPSQVLRFGTEGADMDSEEEVEEEIEKSTYQQNLTSDQVENILRDISSDAPREKAALLLLLLNVLLVLRISKNW